MIETLGLYFTAYSKAVAGNPLLAGFALWATTVLSYLARNVPRTLWNWFSDGITTSVEMNNAGYSGNEFHFTLFLTWFMKSPWAKWSRSLYTGRAYGTSGTEETVIGPGYGRHFFFYKGRFFWFRKTSLDSGGSERVKDSIRIATFGRSHQPILDLIKAFEYKKRDNEIDVFEFTANGGWQRVTSIAKVGLETLFIDPDIQEKLLRTHDHFVNKRQWYLERGMAYKITNLFYGPPGTGKTSIVKVLASYYNRNVCILDLSSVSNKSLQLALATLPPRSILLMEDVDAASHAVDKRQDNSAVKESMFSDIMEPLTLAGLLNALDGIIPLHDVMVFMTTNKRDKLDDALVRKSRVDFEYEIGPMANDQIHGFVELMYPDERVHSSTVFIATTRGEVQGAFRENPDSLVGFLKQMKIIELDSHSAKIEMAA